MSSIIIDFSGLAGSGKSYICHIIKIKLEEKGYTPKTLKFAIFALRVGLV